MIEQLSGKEQPALIEIPSPSGRLLLRQFSMQDVEEMYDLIDRNRDFVDQYDNNTSKNYPDLDYARERTLHPPNPKRLRFGIRISDNTLVGSINLTPDDDKPGEGEIGYYLGQEFIGNGYMTEAVDVISKFAFSHGYKQLWAHVHPDNKPSQKVLERAGYLLGEKQLENGDFRYSLIHSLLNP